MKCRIGNGYDVHGFADEESVGASITLGGINIPSKRELLAHSDGDVLTHALCDALLGALALGDIGEHFPDTDEQYKGLSSLKLLETVFSLVQQKNWQISNVDITVVTQTPKLSPYKSAINQQLSETLMLANDQVSIKATTTEGLGFTGREEGIAVYAVVLLQR